MAMAERDDAPPVPTRRGVAREVWVGLFVLVGFLSGLILLFALTDPAMFRGRYFVHTQVEDAGGIRKSDPVRMVGVVIGRVLSFKLDPQSGKVAMRLEVESEYKVPKDSRLEIRSKNFWGEMVAEIIPGTSTEYLQNGDSLPGKLAAGMLSGEGTEEIAKKAQEAVDRMNRMLSDQAIKSVEASTVELSALLKELGGIAGEQRGELLAISKSLRKSAAGIEGAATRPELQEAIKKTDALMVRLDDVSQSLGRSSRSLETVMARVEKGEGSLGKLLKDEELYKNLNTTVENVNKLVVDLREHPRRYLKMSLF
jgi:phospholipid/cholesterol/gamma-HCH transport system substrate-binding protein